MRFDPTLLEGPVAFVFPGQGAQGPRMLEPFREAPAFARHHALVRALLGGDPLVIAERNPEHLRANAVSSLLTVLASVVCLSLVRERHPSFEPAAVAGYSVGQWTALHAAGALDAAELFRIVAERARLMDECLAAAPPGGMLAVIGVRIADVEAACDAAARSGALVEIANRNAPGQCTIAGDLEGLRLVEERLVPLRPKRLLRLPVAGAWHGRRLEPAVAPLAALLDRTPLAAPRIPVVDNTTGGWLPEEDGARRAALARQVACPVRWMEGVALLAKHGVRSVIEIGYGDVLTKFGFFIDRTLRHVAVAPPPRKGEGAA